ncbi:MAG: hypothetical protein R3E10_06680 [Gemmatimonadota bacterium]
MQLSRAVLFTAWLQGGLVAACDKHPTSPPYDPVLPTDWAADITNPWFPFLPGSSQRFEQQTDEGLETVVVEMLTVRRTVNGVSAVVVHDRVYLEGDLIEDTYDWYAQDSSGNVWYLGEDSKEIENGQVVSTHGSWEWAVDGALPGIIMWANPGQHIGEEYRQEFYEGEAEDWAKVLAVGETVVVPAGTFTNCVRTDEWNGLESASHEDKLFCSGIGFTLGLPQGGGRVELLERTGS